MPIAKSCIVCGARTTGASRCPAHANRGHLLPRSCMRCGASGVSDGNLCDPCEAQLERDRSTERERSGARDHYHGNYQRRAEAVRRSAYANNGPCMYQCGRGTVKGDPWQACHVIDGDPTSPLKPGHRSCNIADSNRKRAAR